MKRILLHGLGQNETSWDGTKALLQLDVLCPNLFDLVNGALTYKNLYSSFEAWLNGLDERVDICGLSLGGVLALNYARDHAERVNSLILIGTPYTIPKLQFKLQAAMFRCMPAKTFEAMGAGKKNILSLTASMGDLDIGSFARDVKCRTLVLCGEKDGANGKYLKDFQNVIPDCKSKLIEGAGHEVNLDAPCALADTISSFWD